MNINVVFDFWATWKFVVDGFVSNLKVYGDPRIVGTKLDYLIIYIYINIKSLQLLKKLIVINKKEMKMIIMNGITNIK